MAVKRYIHYPSHMAELTPQKLAAANYHGYQKYVTEEDYAALEGQLNLMSKSREAWKESATALEKERDALQAECERLREEVYKLSPKQVLEPVDTQILDGFGRLPE